MFGKSIAVVPESYIVDLLEDHLKSGEVKGAGFVNNRSDDIKNFTIHLQSKTFFSFSQEDRITICLEWDEALSVRNGVTATFGNFYFSFSGSEVFIDLLDKIVDLNQERAKKDISREASETHRNLNGARKILSKKVTTDV